MRSPEHLEYCRLVENGIDLLFHSMDRPWRLMPARSLPWTRLLRFAHSSFAEIQALELGEAGLLIDFPHLGRFPRTFRTQP